MRKFIVPLAAAVSALAFATPAAAQFFPGQPYGYGYNNYGQVRMLQARIDSLQLRIGQLDRRNMISGRDAHRLRDESYNLERRLRYSARFGLNPYETNDIQRRVVMLEQRVQFASANRWNRYGYNGYNGYNGYYAGNDDRYERDHERWHENHDGDNDDQGGDNDD